MPARRSVPILAFLVKLLHNHFHNFAGSCAGRYVKLQQQRKKHNGYFDNTVTSSQEFPVLKSKWPGQPTWWACPWRRHPGAGNKFETEAQL